MEYIRSLEADVFPAGQLEAKATPLQAWTGPEGSRKLRLQDFKTIGTWR